MLDSDFRVKINSWNSKRTARYRQTFNIRIYFAFNRKIAILSACIDWTRPREFELYSLRDKSARGRTEIRRRNARMRRAAPCVMSRSDSSLSKQAFLNAYPTCLFYIAIWIFPSVLWGFVTRRGTRITWEIFIKEKKAVYRRYGVISNLMTANTKSVPSARQTVALYYLFVSLTHLINDCLACCHQEILHSQLIHKDL